MKTDPSKSPTPRRKNPFFLHGITTWLTIALFTGRVVACDFCLRLPRVPFQLDHPAAIEVAMATHAAAEQGQLELNPLVDMDKGRKIALAEVSTQQLVAHWIRTRPAQSHPSLRCTIELVFVDVDDTCWLDIRLGEILPGDPRSGPADVRLMTTRAGFCKLREEGLSRCEKLQWAAVESVTSANNHGIERLFSTRSTVDPTDVVLRYDRQRTAVRHVDLIRLPGMKRSDL